VNKGMLKRPTTWLAAGVWVLILLLAGGIVAMKEAGWQGAGNTNDTTGIALFLSLFAFATMGALVAARVPRNAVGWIFLAIPLFGALAGFAENVAFQGLYYDPGTIPGAVAAGWVYAWVWYPTIGLLGFVLLLYPTGTVPGPRWRPVAWALGVVLAVMTLGYMLYPGPLDKDKRLPDNPLGIAFLKSVFDHSDRVAAFSMLGLLVAAVASVIVRFRRSRGDERQQMKWMALAATFLVTGFIVQSALNLGDISFSIAISMLPLALGVAMFKYRLYEVDRVINKALVYGVSSALLAGAYVGLVIASEALLASVARGSSVAVAVSTLVVAGLFLPVRSRVQGFVDRRFYRRRYDAQRTLESFSARLREQVELDGLRVDLERIVNDTMRPASVSVWLRTGTRTSEPDERGRRSGVRRMVRGCRVGSGADAREVERRRAAFHRCGVRERPRHRRQRGVCRRWARPRGEAVWKRDWVASARRRTQPVAQHSLRQVRRLRSARASWVASRRHRPGRACRVGVGRLALRASADSPDLSARPAAVLALADRRVVARLLRRYDVDR
jgi:hypothetical protein